MLYRQRHTRRAKRRGGLRSVAGALATLLVGALLQWTFVATAPHASAATDTGAKEIHLYTNADGTKTGWTQNGCTASTYYACIADDPGASDEDVSRVYGPNDTNTNNTGTFQLTDTPADFGSAISVRITATAAILHSSGGDDLEKLQAALSTGGDTTALTATSSQSTLGTGYLNYTWDVAITGTNSKTAFDAARIKFIGAYSQTGSPDSGTFLGISSAVVDIKYLPSSNLPKLNQDRYIWENDDEDQASYDAPDNNDENTQQAPGNTAITGVGVGERLSARIQVRNTGDALANRDLGLFYDHGDGYWAKVQDNAPVTTTGSTCSDTTLFDCTNVETGLGNNSSMAIDSNGSPWVVSRIGSGTSGLRLDHYVGNGGNCASGAWACETIYNSGTSGDFAAITLDTTNTPWISFIAATNDLYVAHFVGSGGSGCTGATNSAAWTCTAVDTAATASGKTAIALDDTGNPWVSYNDAGANNDLKVASYNGASWTLTSVDTAVNGGTNSSIAFDQTNTAWVSYYDAGNGHLKVAKYSGSWTLSTVDSGTSVGQYTSIAIAPDGYPRISYYDATNTDVKFATYNGASWSTTTPDSQSGVGLNTSLSFAPDGNPWIASYDNTNHDLRLDRYNGTSWSNTSIDTTGDVGNQPDIEFGPDGTAWISQYSTTAAALRVMHQARSGEIITGSGLAHGHNNTIAESHSDMTAVPDNTDRDSANCQTGTWNNGLATDGSELNGLSLPAGSSTNQCTEISFTIDTSRALTGQQYRFVVASRDSWNPDQGNWRGPVSISAYPTLTTAGAITQHFSKDSEPSWSACTTNANYQCTSAFTNSGFSFDDTALDVAMGPNGNPWVVYSDYQGGNEDIYVAHYVGSSGTGCATGTAWTCYKVVAVSKNAVEGLRITVAPDGSPWVMFNPTVGSSVVRVARYVGSGGTGCDSSAYPVSTAWTCSNITSLTGVTVIGEAIGFDTSGTAWVMFHDQGNGPVYVAQYVGAGGTGCTDQSWTCTEVETDGGWYGNIAFDPSGHPWISGGTGNTTPHQIRVAHYVGAGGSGCVTAAWTCWIVDGSATDDVGSWDGLAVDSSGVAWVSYRDETNGALKLANWRPSGTGGTTCPNSQVAWDCQTIDNGASYGTASAIAIAPDGTKWISNENDSTKDLRLVHSVAGAPGGSGCSAGWVCETVEASGIGGRKTYMAMDPLGQPYVTWIDSSWIPWLIHPASLVTKPNLSSNAGTDVRDGRWSMGRYTLDSGYSPRSTTSCASTAGDMGYCGVAAVDSNYDSIIANTNEMPLYTYATAFSHNDGTPIMSWTGKSTDAPSSKALTAEVWNNTTLSWETLTTTVNNCAGALANTDCTITGHGSSSASTYLTSVSGQYWAYFRIRQAVDTSSSVTLSTNAVNITQNRPPQTPASLDQQTTGGTSIPVGGWNNSTSVKFVANVSDLDSADTDYLCVEEQPVTSSFTNTETACGSGVSYSGTAIAASVTLTLTNSTKYHWQARVKDSFGNYSAWQSFGGNSDTVTAATDIGIDTTAPTTGTVYDGSSAGVQSNFNSGSLSSLSCNWTGFGDSYSGIASYDYSFGTSPGGTQILGWTNVGSGTTNVTANSLTLHTNQRYYCNVRANDAATNQSSVVTSSGQLVAPTLTFTVGSTSVAFAALNGSNSWTDTKTFTLTTSTNAYGGYYVVTSESGPQTSSSSTIADYASPASSPTTWSGTGFGYNVSGGASVAAFSGSKYAHFGTLGSPDIPVSHSSAVSGTPISNEQETVTLKVAVSSTGQPPGAYSTVLKFGCVAIY